LRRGIGKGGQSVLIWAARVAEEIVWRISWAFKACNEAAAVVRSQGDDGLEGLVGTLKDSFRLPGCQVKAVQERKLALLRGSSAGEENAAPLLAHHVFAIAGDVRQRRARVFIAITNRAFPDQPGRLAGLVDVHEECTRPPPITVIIAHQGNSFFAPLDSGPSSES